MAVLPEDHQQRQELNDEVHARPPGALTAPVRISYLALFSRWSRREQEWQHVSDLARAFGQKPPRPGANHFNADLGDFEITWERHTEFARYAFAVSGAKSEPFDEPALDLVPKEWIAGLQGQLMVAIHAVVLRPGRGSLDHEAIARRYFDDYAIVGAAVSGGAATALADFRIRSDRFSRLLVHDRSMTPRQAGRTLQRLFEIDTYRVMALLALPVARELSPFLSQCEQELAQITSSLVSSDKNDEAALFDRLTRLQAEIETRESDTAYRFGAARAYHEIVRRRIAELREQRIQGLQTFQEFTERRLAPAMNTCVATSERQNYLSQRMARATQLLSTRVGIAREQQNRAVLESMNRRARVQIRLQETVEGLSVAAVTYYIVGLVGYAAQGIASAGAPFNPDIVMAASIPVVATAVALGVRKIRKAVTRAAP